ncbi:MAG: hydroxymethylbilane synthase [Bacteroidota bacterium]
MQLKIGTRKSQLALWQARHVAQLLDHHGVETEIVGIETKGDKVLDVSIAKIGSKGVFTEELEDMLATGEVDIAVHSAKDLQSSLPGGFEIAAFTEREQVADVIVSKQSVDMAAPLRLGTSSTRRQALFKKYYPHIDTVPIRGNLQTRIAKMENGDCDALALAFAGVHRMGYEGLIKARLDTQQFVPPVGQGALAIEIHHTLTERKRAKLRQALNDPTTEQQLLAERAFLKKLDGGCSIPAFGLAQVNGEQITMTGGVISLDGARMVKHVATGSEPQSLGIVVADYILSHGGDQILKEIKETL